MGRLYHQKPGISSLQFGLQLSIWVLLVSQHDQHVDCAVLVAFSPPAFRFVIGQVFIDSRSKTPKFRVKFAIISQPLHEYQSDCIFECKRWISGKSWTIYVLAMLWYQHDSNTQLEPKLVGLYEWNRGPVPTPSNTHGSMSGPGNKSRNTKRICSSDTSVTEPNRTSGQNLDRWQVTWTRC